MIPPRTLMTKATQSEVTTEVPGEIQVWYADGGITVLEIRLNGQHLALILDNAQREELIHDLTRPE